MKELAISLQGKTISDLEHIYSTNFSQITTAENFLAVAVSEAEQVLEGLQISIAEEKELLAFSVRQQEERLQRSLASVQAISNKTLDFFSDLQRQACRLLRVIEGNQMETSYYLEDFEKKFKDLSANEERVALEKIAGILTHLTIAKSNLVMEAVKGMNATNCKEKNRLLEEMSSVCLVSDQATSEWNKFMENVDRQFQEDVSSVSSTRMKMENILHCCSERVGQSKEHLENAKQSVGQLNKDYAAEIESSIQTINQQNNDLVRELTSTSTQTDMKFQIATSDMLATVNGALSVDHETSNEIGSFLNMCKDHLQALQDAHTERIKDIQNSSERCLFKEYLVDHPTSTTPERKHIQVPSLASVEALRTPALAELVKGMRSENRQSEIKHGGKQPFLLPLQTTRSPLTPINLG